MTDGPNETGSFRRQVPPEGHVTLRFDKFSSFVEEYRACISLGGVFIKTHRPRPIGSEVHFEFKLTDGFRLLHGQGAVLWARSRDLGPELPAGMGVRFTAIDESGRQLVLKLLEEQVKAGGEPFEVDKIPEGGANSQSDADLGLEEATLIGTSVQEVNPDLPNPAEVTSAKQTELGFDAPWGKKLPGVPTDLLGEAEEPDPEIEKAVDKIRASVQAEPTNTGEASAGEAEEKPRVGTAPMAQVTPEVPRVQPALAAPAADVPAPASASQHSTAQAASGAAPAVPPVSSNQEETPVAPPIEPEAAPASDQLPDSQYDVQDVLAEEPTLIGISTESAGPQSVLPLSPDLAPAAPASAAPASAAPASAAPASAAPEPEPSLEDSMMQAADEVEATVELADPVIDLGPSPESISFDLEPADRPEPISLDAQGIGSAIDTSPAGVPAFSAEPMAAAPNFEIEPTAEMPSLDAAPALDMPAFEAAPTIEMPSFDAVPEASTFEVPPTVEMPTFDAVPEASTFEVPPTAEMPTFDAVPEASTFEVPPTTEMPTFDAALTEQVPAIETPMAAGAPPSADLAAVVEPAPSFDAAPIVDPPLSSSFDGAGEGFDPVSGEQGMPPVADLAVDPIPPTTFGGEGIDAISEPGGSEATHQTADFVDPWPEQEDATESWEDDQAEFSLPPRRGAGRYLVALALVVALVGGVYFFRSTLAGMVGLGDSGVEDEPAQTASRGAEKPTAQGEEPPSAARSAESRDSETEPDPLQEEQIQVSAEQGPALSDGAQEEPAELADAPIEQAATKRQPVAAPALQDSRPSRSDDGDQRASETQSQRDSQVSVVEGERAITDIRWTSVSQGTRISIRFSRPISTDDFKHDPLAWAADREMLTLFGVENYPKGEILVGTSELKRIRLGFHPGQELRLVFDLGEAGTAVQDLRVIESGLDLVVQ